MRTLDRKLLRDLVGLRGQAIAIAMVIVSGVATFVMSVSTLDSLRRTQETYYRDYRFADAFVSLKRAPEEVRSRIREIPGVDFVETRVVAAATLDIPGFPDPVRAKLVSVPDEGAPLLNGVYLRQGRMVDPRRDDEVVVSEPFAEAHRFLPGDAFAAVINGKRKTLKIAGIGLSPEHIYQISPGALFPDYKRYGVLWMARQPLATAYDMEGAFNDVALKLAPGASLPDVILRLDDLLTTYGGLGAYGRKDQVSHRYLSEEFRQLGTLATIFPVIFLGVAAFLLNIVLSRLVGTQREQIAALKAFGYANRDIGIHYAKLVALIALAGSAVGMGAGIWLGQGLSELYMDFYRFPFLNYALSPGKAATACLVSIAAALLGALQAVRRAALLPPAEAMRPEPPERFRETAIERAGLKRLLSQPGRMIARHIARRPVKSLLSVAGVALACAILMIGQFQEDAIDFMVDVEFRAAQREHLTVAFVEPTSRGAIHELRSMEGVEFAEPYRTVPVRLRSGHRTYRTTLRGIEPGARLYRLLDTGLRPIEMPSSGILLTDQLGKILGVRAGDRVTVEALEGRRPVREVPIAALVKQYVGVSGYMDLSALNRLMGEGEAISGAYLFTDRRRLPEIYRKLKEMPRVAGTAIRENEIRSFYETLGETLLVFTFINTLLAGTIAFGVVYNSARIALSERSRELASLRVLGYTRGEISYILLGELAVITLAALAPGFLIGRGLCAYIATNLASDLYRVPLILEPDTYAFAATVVLVSACVSGLLVRRRLDRLDLVAVLKMRE
ncbi:MAG TPA: FtsX-like permease family protein [Candidatus Deferrimicrobiaceae bacterium]|nr:FtsX-like permease family protein [Candidatus Deferrimicrobiaceae bacterium]